MKRHGKRYQLDVGGDEHRYQLLAEIGQGPGSDNRSVEQLARVIRAKHRQYGEVKLDQQTFQSFIENFNNNAYGQDLFIDVAHRPEDGAAGEIKRLFTEGDALLAEIEWTPRGAKAIKEDGFRYFSIDFHDNYEDPETNKQHGPTLFGAALVTRPFIKRMRPVQGRMFFSEDRRLWVPGYLSVSKGGDMEKWLKKLREALAKYNLAEGVIKQVVEAFKTQAKELGEDEAALEAAFGVYDKMGKALGEQIGGQEVTVKLDDLPDFSGGGGNKGAGTQLTQEDIDKLLQKKLDERDRKAREAKEEEERKLSEVNASFEKQLDEAEGLSDETRESLKKDWNPMLSGDMSEDQVKKLAEKVIKAGHEIERSRKLTEMGYELPGGAGQYIQMGDEPVGKRLGADLRKRLGNSAEGRLSLPDEDKCSPFVKKVLATFDHRNAKRLEQESKVLAGDGSTNIGDGDFPVAAQRQVILESLSDLRFLDLVQTNVDPQATVTTQIPYEERNTSQVRNGGRVYEGKPIPAAGVTQKMDIAYIEPRKISMLMSNEMMHFSRASRIDWDAWARNIASNARLMRELVTADIANSYLRAADSYLASEVVDEDLEPQFDGATSEMKLANFPLVRPHQQHDMQGNTVGSADNPISLSLAGSTVEEWDGTGDQAAGTYYKVTSYNLGKIQFVDEAGDPVTPADTTTSTITYWYATNVVKFDLDTPSGEEYEKHLNGLLHRIGRRKALLADERFVRPNFVISSHTLHQTVSEAEQFTVRGARGGTGADSEGMVDQVKGIPAWATNEPGIDLGDERLLIGERGTMGYTIAKAFQVGDPFEAVDSATGRPTGQKIAYGEEYSALKVPDPIRDRLTSVLAYSATGR